MSRAELDRVRTAWPGPPPGTPAHDAPDHGTLLVVIMGVLHTAPGWAVGLSAVGARVGVCC